MLVHVNRDSNLCLKIDSGIDVGIERNFEILYK
ncbi:protein of unknown function [uncultured Sphingopyxis sp.]|uniref:Uncharacterized protein n=1 Tax=uncultured Sphingopyxis sp. TaxID=310581 RepID=A0A1Y5PWK6_9SPHN|nr:protein of unknown function [uncultured Sphingopyxis sp.]